MAYSCFTCGRIANQRYRRSLSEPIRIVHRFHWQACLSYRHPWSAALVCQQASNQIPAHRTAGPWGFAAFLPFGARGLCKQSFFTQYCFIWILIQFCFVDETCFWKTCISADWRNYRLNESLRWQLFEVQLKWTGIQCEIRRFRDKIYGARGHCGCSFMKDVCISLHCK